MENYDATSIEGFMRQYERHVTHVIVAHTRFRPFEKPQKIIDEYARQSKKDLRHALNVFGASLHPTQKNRARRYPYQFAPLVFSTLEGAHETENSCLTLHFNLCLGNLPPQLTTEEIEKKFVYAWHKKANQSSDIKIFEYKNHNTQTWLGYQLKEAQQPPNLAWDTNGIWDVENCWIPHAALSED